MKLNKLSKKARIIILVSIATLGVGGVVGIQMQKENQLQSADNYIKRYVVPGKEKVFMVGKVMPRETASFNYEPERGTLDRINVENEQYVQKGAVLYSYKNKEVMNELHGLLSEIRDLTNKKSTAPDWDTKVELEKEIAELQKKANVLNEKRYDVVYAPYDGVVYLNSKMVREAGEEILTIDTGDFYLGASVNERDSFKIAKGQDVELKVLSNDKEYKGKIEYVSNKPLGEVNIEDVAMTEMSMTKYGVTVKIDDAKGLKSGLSMQCEVAYGDESWKIPNTAMLDEGDKQYVYIVEDNGDGTSRYTKTEVKVKEMKESFALVNSGVKPGTVIIKDLSMVDLERLG